MLKELLNVRQKPDEGFRRWFADEYFDLIIWYDERMSIKGFQLCYDKQDQERAITWKREQTFSHSKVDSGEISYGMSQTPVLFEDGPFDKEAILKEFINRSKQLEPDLRKYIKNKIKQVPIFRNSGTDLNLAQ